MNTWQPTLYDLTVNGYLIGIDSINILFRYPVFGEKINERRDMNPLYGIALFINVKSYYNWILKNDKLSTLKPTN